MQSWQPMGRYFCRQLLLYNAVAECVHGRWKCKFNRIEQNIFILARSMSSRIRNKCDDPGQYRFIKQGSTLLSFAIFDDSQECVHREGSTKERGCTKDVQTGLPQLL